MPRFRTTLIYNVLGVVFSCIMWAVALTVPFNSVNATDILWSAILVGKFEIQDKFELGVND